VNDSEWAIVDLFPRALAVMAELLDSDDAEIRYRAAALILQLSTRLTPVP